MHDLLIREARIYDGTGNDWFAGSIAVSGDSMEIMRGDTTSLEAQRVIDATGLAVCPGFIDMHAHSTMTVLAAPRHDPKVRQGVTTELMGVDGNSYAPFVDADDLERWSVFNAGLDGEKPAGLAGRVAVPGYVLGAFNTALLHLTKSVADHVAKDGIGVVAVNPGLTETDRMQDALRTWADEAGVPQHEFVAAYLSANVPAGRFAKPQEIARVVAFLASDAAGYISGTSVFVDGASLKGF